MSDNTKRDMKQTGPPAPEFGPAGDGTYVTPFAITVVFDPNNAVETAIATLCDQCQAIPFDYSKCTAEGADDADCVAAKTIKGCCAHPSPDILLFKRLNQDAIDIIRSRGFQRILIAEFNNNSPADAPSADAADVHYIGLASLYDYLPLTGILPVYLLEHIICAKYPNYTPVADEVNHERGVAFLEGILSGNVALPVALFNLLNYKGFDGVEKYVVRGKCALELAEKVANRLIENGFIVDNCTRGSFYDPKKKPTKLRYYVVCGSEPIVDRAVLELARLHPKIVKSGCSYVLLYHNRQQRVHVNAILVNDKTENIAPFLELIGGLIKGRPANPANIEFDTTVKLAADLLMINCG